MNVAWLINVGKRLGAVLFWVTVAPILMAIDLAVMVVTLDRDRLEAVPENLRYSFESLLARHRRRKVDDGLYGREGARRLRPPRDRL